MKNCKHKWRYYNLQNMNDYKLYIDRECKLCGRKEHRGYQGGGMWRWEKVSK